MKRGLILVGLLLLPALSACPLDALSRVLSDEECLDIIAEFADPLLPSQTDLASIEGAEERCAAIDNVRRGLNGGCCPHPWLDLQEGVEDSEGLCALLETQLVAPTAACDAAECFTDEDCDDSVFCNGLETCDTQTLQCLAGASPCIVDCDEQTEACAPTDTFAVFVDPDSSFSTTDVLDVDEEVVRFDTSANSIIWAANSQAFQEGNWVVDGNFLGATGMFQVRFGTVDGDRRAYFTETGPATICDISVTDQGIRIVATSVPVPGN